MCMSEKFINGSALMWHVITLPWPFFLDNTVPENEIDLSVLCYIR